MAKPPYSMSRVYADLQAAGRLAKLDAAEIRSLFQRNLTKEMKAILWRVGVLPKWGQSHDFVVETVYHDKFSGNRRDCIASTIYYFGVWEPFISEYVRKVLRPGNVFVDVGANQGWYSVLASRLVGNTGSIVAIEPSSFLIGNLQTNLQINNCANVKVIRAAAWHSRDDLTLYLGPSENLGVTTLIRNWVPDWPPKQTETVSAAPLTELIQEEFWPRIRLIKIDVEGAEDSVLKGMMELLLHVRPDCELIMEVTVPVSTAGDRKASDILEPLMALRFNAFYIKNSYDPNFYLNWKHEDVHQSMGLYGPIRSVSDFRRFYGPTQTSCDLIFSRRNLAEIPAL